MLKQRILTYLTKKNAKARPHEDLIGYSDCKDIGILINSEDQYGNVNEMADQLRSDGKQVTIVNIEVNGSVMKTNDFPSASRKDIDWKGDFLSHHILNFIKRDFDFLLVLDHQKDLFVQYIASCSKAKCTVGFSELTPGFIDLQIRPEKNRELYDVLKYTRMVSNGGD